MGKTIAAVVLLGSLWGVSRIHDTGRTWQVRPVGAPRGPVKITRFYANTGLILAGEKARLCYGVENAKSVQITPLVPGVYPAENRCLDIVPEHTTHYSIMAEGFDGRTATRFFTLLVERPANIPRESLNLAD